MDKFGIFNLLNSFFSFNKSENGQSGNSSAPSSELLGNLLNSLSSNKQAENNNQKATLSPPMPLQNSMLSTINSHDAIVKRVKEKQK